MSGKNASGNDRNRFPNRFSFEVSVEAVEDHISTLSATEFEEFVAAIWERRGFETESTPGSHDGGIDIDARRESPYLERHRIQVKHYSENHVDTDDVLRYAGLNRTKKGHIDAVVIVTSSGFTAGAKDRAADGNVKLIGPDELAKLIASAGAVDLLAAPSTNRPPVSLIEFADMADPHLYCPGCGGLQFSNSSGIPTHPGWTAFCHSCDTNVSSKALLAIDGARYVDWDGIDIPKEGGSMPSSLPAQLVARYLFWTYRELIRKGINDEYFWHGIVLRIVDDFGWSMADISRIVCVNEIEPGLMYHIEMPTTEFGGANKGFHAARAETDYICTITSEGTLEFAEDSKIPDDLTGNDWTAIEELIAEGRLHLRIPGNRII